MYFPHDIKIDCGQYEVEEVLCYSEEDYNKIIKDFAYTLDEDENALLTCNQTRAYLYMCERNRQLNEAIDEELVNIYLLLKKEEDVDFVKFSEDFNKSNNFELNVFKECEGYVEFKRNMRMGR